MKQTEQIFVCLDLLSLQTGFWESLIMWKNLVSSHSEFTALAPVTWKLDLFCLCHDSPDECLKMLYGL